jgi:hypothetical protein
LPVRLETIIHFYNKLLFIARFLDSEKAESAFSFNLQDPALGQVSLINPPFKPTMGAIYLGEHKLLSEALG